MACEGRQGQEQKKEGEDDMNRLKASVRGRYGPREVHVVLLRE